MQAVIFGLMMPIIPLLIRKLYRKGENLTAAQAVEHYMIYTLVTALVTTAAMAVLGDDGTSFMEKADRLPSFVLKYVFLEAVTVALIALGEWVFTTGRLKVTVDREKYRNSIGGKFCRKFLFPAGLFLLALLAAGLNASLIKDNVVWGDEAYTCNAIRNDLGGIFQILTLEENHPPLHFLWLKAFAEIFGYSIPVYHFASFVPFCMGIGMAVIFLRKRYGNIPAAFFVMISGLAAPCLEYNMEIRMYALAFLGMAGCYYSVSRIMSGSKVLGWIGMVFWALVAAYSHYYALVAAGMMVFFACVAVYWRYRGKIWIKGLVSLGMFVALYLPWLSQVFRATRHVSNHWWMTEIESLGSSLEMIGCGPGMYKIILPLLLLLAVVLLGKESSLFRIEKREERILVNITTPSAQKWSDETYTFAVGGLTIAGTLAFAYGLSVLMRPLVTGRYLYPLCAVSAMMLVTGVGRCLNLLGQLEERFQKKWFVGAGKFALVLILALLLAAGLGNYRNYRDVVKYEDARTGEVLYYIGEPGEGTEFVNNGIMHIGWTVLQYYYPDTKLTNGTYKNMSAEDVWYFTPDFLEGDQIADLEAMGYRITANYGEMQLGKYPFVLYRFVKAPMEGSPETSTESQ